MVLEGRKEGRKEGAGRTGNYLSGCAAYITHIVCSINTQKKLWGKTFLYKTYGGFF